MLKRLQLLAASTVLACIAAACPAQTSRPAFHTTTDARLPGARAYRSLPYGPVPSANTLDLYIPDKPAGKLPLIIWVHGGGWEAGDKFPLPITSLSGFALASINYRYSWQAKFPAQLLDCKGAVRFLRANAADLGLDDKRFAAWGASAGGHLVALLGTTNGDKSLEGDVGGNLAVSSDVQAVCDWFGPTNFLTIRAQIEKVDPASPMLAEPTLVSKLVGDITDESKMRSASPFFHVTGNAVPFLVVQGARDKLVPPAQSMTFVAALKNAGAKADLEMVNDAGHGGGGFGSAAVLERSVRFMLDAMR